MAGAIAEYVITPHAAFEMQRRGISEEAVRQVLRAPEQRLAIRSGRDVMQARLDLGGTPYLVRVFVDVDRSPAEVVTVYRTGKISRYWRPEP